MKIYAIEGSSYDGCNGWSSWVMEGTITTSYEKIKETEKIMKDRGIRTKIIVVAEE